MTIDREKYNDHKVRVNRYILSLIQMLAQDAANVGNDIISREKYNEYKQLEKRTEQNHTIELTKKLISLHRKFHIFSFLQIEDFLWNPEKINLLDLLVLCCEWLAACEKEGMPEIEQYIDKEANELQLNNDIVCLLKNTVNLLKEAQL